MFFYEKNCFVFLSIFLFISIPAGLVYAGSPEYDQAYAVYQNQGAAAAAPLFKKIVENTPDPDAMWMLGYIYKNQANFDTMYAESAKWYKNYLQFPFVKKDFAMHELGQIYKTGGYGLKKISSRRGSISKHWWSPGGLIQITPDIP